MLHLHSLHQLSETLELGSEDYRRIGFEEGSLVRPLREALEGRMEMGALARRVRRLAQIFSVPEYLASSVHRPELTEALSLLSMVLDPHAPLAPDRIPVYLAPVLAALERRQAAPFPAVLGQILKDLEGFHFTTLTPLDLGASPRRPRLSGNGGDPALPWTDLALLYGPPGDSEDAGGDPPDHELAPVWFIPLSVTTRHFYREGLPEWLEGEEVEAPWMHIENCKMARLRERHPWLPVERYRPAYLVDPRGFAEIVLDTSDLSREDIAFAIRVFALQNDASAASLDGEPVELYPTAC